MGKEKERNVPRDPILLILEFFHWLGEFLIWDDLDDYGRLDRIHHWQIGEILRQTSQILGLSYVLHDVLSEIQKLKKATKSSVGKNKKKWKKITVS